VVPLDWSVMLDCTESTVFVGSAPSTALAGRRRLSSDAGNVRRLLVAIVVTSVVLGCAGWVLAGWSAIVAEV
jgi:hypothetical protein